MQFCWSSCLRYEAINWRNATLSMNYGRETIENKKTLERKKKKRKCKIFWGLKYQQPISGGSFWKLQFLFCYLFSFSYYLKRWMER